MYENKSKLSEVPRETNIPKDFGKPNPIEPSPELLEKIKDLSLKEQVIQILKTIFDPEIPVDIWELGLIYNIEENEEDGSVNIDMTLTSPACPVAESLPIEVEAKIMGLPKVKYTNLAMVWDPPWTQDMMSDEAKVELDMFY